MNEIARKVGVSRPTVSYILNGKASRIQISPETRRRVLGVAEECGYRRNDVARAIATGRTRSIGFVIMDIGNEVAGRLLQGALNAAQENGFQVRILGTGGDERELPRKCVELRLEGVICSHLPDALLDQLGQELTKHAIPGVMVDSSFERPGFFRVISADEPGIRLALEHLASLGHARIGFIGGNPATGSAVLRERGFRAGMRALGLPIPPGYVRKGNWVERDTDPAARALLAQRNRPTAIVCASDYMAATVLRVASRLGVRVPQDLSVLGFADVRLAQYVTPALTTVSQPFEEMGRTAMRRLLEVLAKRKRMHQDPAPTIALPTRLVVRESSGPAPARAAAVPGRG